MAGGSFTTTDFLLFSPLQPPGLQNLIIDAFCYVCGVQQTHVSSFVFVFVFVLMGWMCASRRGWWKQIKIQWESLFLLLILITELMLVQLSLQLKSFCPSLSESMTCWYLNCIYTGLFQICLFSFRPLTRSYLSMVKTARWHLNKST